MNIKNIIDPDDPLWSLRRGSRAVITLSFSYTRYVNGEIVVETCYTLQDDMVNCDDPFRLFLGATRKDVITNLWDTLFDSVLVARDYAVNSVEIDFHRIVQEHWDRDLLIAVLIVAHELSVPVIGLFQARSILHQRPVSNLSDDLANALYQDDGEEQDAQS
jgi:hypothetical protein